MSHQATYKPIVEEASLDDIPSSLELALNSNKPLLPVPYLLDPEGFRRLSVSTISSHGRGRSPSHVSHARYTSRSPAPPVTWKASLAIFWARNRGLALVAISQLFGALMNVTTRVLELEGDGMEPFQILFVRMGLTMLCCIIYMWWKKVPDFPLGPKDARSLLVARGLSGFFGIFGMYYSLQYLPMADATVITFLAPSVAGYVCYLLIGEPFTRKEQIASYVALLGVVLIARPSSFFNSSSPESLDGIGHNATTSATSSVGSHSDFDSNPTNAQRLSAIAVSLLGVLGSAGAYTTIRWIGQRAHPLLSVNYFATWCTIVSTTVLSIGPHLPPPIYSPTLHFAFPSSIRQWSMLIFLGTCGFVMQFLMTAGIGSSKDNRATNMVYTNMLFALLFDRLIFGISPGAWSWAGCGCILGSAVFVAVQKSSWEVDNVDQAAPNGALGAIRGEGMRDEETAMLTDMDHMDGVDEISVSEAEGAQSSGMDIELSEMRT